MKLSQMLEKSTATVETEIATNSQVETTIDYSQFMKKENEDTTTTEETENVENNDVEEINQVDDDTAAEIAALTAIGNPQLTPAETTTQETDEDTQAELDLLKSIAGI